MEVSASSPGWFTPREKSASHLVGPTAVLDTVENNLLLLPGAELWLSSLKPVPIETESSFNMFRNKCNYVRFKTFLVT